MSYKNQREVKTKFVDYDFIDVAGPSTFKQIDSLFHEYCKDISRKDRSSPAIVKQPQGSNVGSRTSLLRPSTAKLSEISTPSSNLKAGWNPSVMARLQPRTAPHAQNAHKGIEFEEDIVGKLHTIINRNQSALNVLDEEINQLSQEFGINLAVLATFHSPEKRHEYVIECMRKRVKDDLKDFNKKHNARLNNILHFEVEFQKIKEKQHKDSSDIFGWLNVNTPHEPLKKKLRSKLAEIIHDYENLNKIETSLEELRKSKDASSFSTTKKIQLDNVPHIDNFEIMQGILAGHSDNLLKMTKSMKHASRKNPDESHATNPNESFHNKKMNETHAGHAGEEKEAEQEDDIKQWNPNRERVFKIYREDAKARLFNKIKSSNWNELGFSPHVQAAQKDEKSKQQRDTKLANYMNGDLLTPEDYKLLANTSITLNKFVDKKYLQTVVNYLDPEIISAIETDLAETTLKDHQKRQIEAREARLKFLKDCNQALLDEVETRHMKAVRHNKVLAGKEEQKKIKHRAVSLLNRVAERKLWKSPPPRIEKPEDNEDAPVDIGHFASKFLKVVNKSVQARKFQKSQEFLRRLLPYHNETKAFDVQDSKHFYHPSSKLLVTTESHAKDYMGLGTENLNPLLAKRRNDSPDDYKLTIHSPQRFKNSQNFRKYYSGGPVDDDDRIFQGGYILGNVANYKFDRSKERVVLKIQAAWRGYRQRQLFKQIRERVEEKKRTADRIDHLKKFTSSNFLKTVLMANDKVKPPKKQKHTTIHIDAAKHANHPNSSNNLNSNPKRYESIGSYSKLNNYDSKLLTLNDTDKAKNMIDLANIRGHHHEGKINSAKSITSVDLNAEDEIPNLKVNAAIDAFKSTKGNARRPQTALTKNSSTASNGALKNKGLELQKQPSVHKQLVEQWHTHTSDDDAPDEVRQNKIAQRAPPKGLLLKQRKLFTAAKTNNFKLIMSSGYNYYESDVNSKDDQGNTPLFYAARHGNKDICEFLVTHKARVNEPCSNGDTPLHMGFSSGNVMVVILLISYGGNLNVLNESGQTAVAFGSESLLTLLDLKEAIATYNKQPHMKNLPGDIDNNRLLSRFQNGKDLHTDYLSFNYAPLKQNLGRVGSARRARDMTSPGKATVDHDDYLD